ncbi:MAG: hypothetical protein KJ630_10410 [Proteobacteria bacterium]|nr:hypothetical protein [Myxococcota bacterium]MBU1566027.1 hypothetical protein [Pseudomonadota bacterium]
MSVEQITYAEARNQMKPGDVIAFGGKGNFSQLIKFATCSDVSHVGVILQTKVVEDTTDRFFNQIIETTTINGFNGVNISRLSARLTDYTGEIWWLPLSSEIRENRFDAVAFYNFLFDQSEARKEYDTPQGIKSVIDVLDKLPFGLHGPGYNEEDFSKFFCSELVAAGLEKAGSVGTVNASEVTPIDLCRWNIFQGTYYQMSGDTSKKISRFNTANPADWDV